MRTPLLAICVPTYNRGDELAELLAQLEPEVAGHDDVVLLVSNNASPDGTEELLAELSATRPWLLTHRQPENLGATGNVKWLIANAPQSEYTWVFCDDDRLEPGALDEILEVLRTERPAVLHLPHHFVKGSGEIADSSPAPGVVDRFATPGDMYRAYHHWLTFATSQIARSEALHAASLQGGDDNAFAPFVWFFRAGLTGPCVVAPHHLIRGGLDITWADQADAYLTRHFVEMYDVVLHEQLSEEDFAATLDLFYKPDGWTFVHWQRVPGEWLLDAVQQFPHSANLRGFLWKIACERRWRDALEPLAEASTVAGADATARELVEQGEEAFEAGDAAGAAALFSSATSHAPTLAEAWSDLSVALHATGNTAAAAAAVETALFIAPGYADALGNQAVIAAGAA